jgi:hypothetical protein
MFPLLLVPFFLFYAIFVGAFTFGVDASHSLVRTDWAAPLASGWGFAWVEGWRKWSFVRLRVHKDVITLTTPFFATFAFPLRGSSARMVGYTVFETEDLTPKRGTITLRGPRKAISIRVGRAVWDEAAAASKDATTDLLEYRKRSSLHRWFG